MFLQMSEAADAGQKTKKKYNENDSRHNRARLFRHVKEIPVYVYNCNSPP